MTIVVTEFLKNFCQLSLYSSPSPKLLSLLVGLSSPSSFSSSSQYLKNSNSYASQMRALIQKILLWCCVFLYIFKAVFTLPCEVLFPFQIFYHVIIEGIFRGRGHPGLINENGCLTLTRLTERKGNCILRKLCEAILCRLIW